MNRASTDRDRIIVSIFGPSGAGKSQLAKAVAAGLGELGSRVPADYFLLPATGPLTDYLARPLVYDWPLLDQVLAGPLGTTVATPRFDFTWFQRTETAEPISFVLRPVMVIDAMYPYPGAALTFRLDVPDHVRRERITARDVAWKTNVAARWQHLERSRVHLDQSPVRPDLTLDGTDPIAANAERVMRRLEQDGLLPAAR